jgi:hypothetical protein
MYSSHTADFVHAPSFWCRNRDKYEAPLKRLSRGSIATTSHETTAQVRYLSLYPPSAPTHFMISLNFSLQVFAVLLSKSLSLVLRLLVESLHSFPQLLSFCWRRSDANHHLYLSSVEFSIPFCFVSTFTMRTALYGLAGTAVVIALARTGAAQAAGSGTTTRYWDCCKPS